MPKTAQFRPYQLKKPPVIGDLIVFKGSKTRHIVVEARDVEDYDRTRGDSYFGYYFETLPAPRDGGLGFTNASVFNPKPKKFFLEGMSMGGPGKGVRLADIEQYGTASVKKSVVVQYVYGKTKTVKTL